MESDLKEPASVDLQGAASIEVMAEREGWDPQKYAIALAEHIRPSEVPLSAQRERLSALAQAGAALSPGADQASADALSQHYVLLEALFQRFSRCAAESLQAGDKGAADRADRFLSAALKAQRAALSVLSALRVIRDAPSTSLAGGESPPVAGRLAPRTN